MAGDECAFTAKLLWLETQWFHLPRRHCGSRIKVWKEGESFNNHYVATLPSHDSAKLVI